MKLVTAIFKPSRLDAVKIFVLTVDSVLRIRTGERDEQALTG